MSLQLCLRHLASQGQGALNTDEVNLPPRLQRELEGCVGVHLRHEHRTVLLDANRYVCMRSLLRVADQLEQPVLPRRLGVLRRAIIAPVVGREAVRARLDPNLNEAQRLGLFVVLLVLHASTRGHELHRAAAEGLVRSHRVGVREDAVDDVRDDLHVAVRVAAEAAAGLHQVVVQHTQAAELCVLRVAVLGEREVEAGFEPVGVGPAGAGLVLRVAEHVGWRLGAVEHGLGHVEQLHARESVWAGCVPRDGRK
mmetsp:Transcript_15187/g.38014  ORF Transcript_15187/g.38014 Transcript_15187/m.38014 type:complete len:253 (-) Transcript_15187:9-767(-)